MITERERKAIMTRSALIQEVLTLEPGLQQVFAIAKDPEPRQNRWVAYEALKRMSMPYVGWTARRPELSTTQHYEAVIQHIDELLPEEPYSNEEYDSE